MQAAFAAFQKRGGGDSASDAALQFVEAARSELNSSSRPHDACIEACKILLASPDLRRATGWELTHLLMPFVVFADPSEPQADGISTAAEAASEALLHAALVGNPKEMHMLVLEGFAYFKNVRQMCTLLEMLARVVPQIERRRWEALTSAIGAFQRCAEHVAQPEEDGDDEDDDNAESMGVDGMDIEGKVRSSLVRIPTSAKAPLLLLCKAAMGILSPFMRYLPPGGKGDHDDMMRHRVAKSLLVILPWLVLCSDGELPPPPWSAGPGSWDATSACQSLTSLPNGLLYAIAPSCRTGRDAVEEQRGVEEEEEEEEDEGGEETDSDADQDAPSISRVLPDLGVGVLIAAMKEWEKASEGHWQFIPSMLSSRWILSACMPGIAALLCSSRQTFMLSGMTLLKVLLSDAAADAGGGGVSELELGGKERRAGGGGSKQLAHRLALQGLIECMTQLQSPEERQDALRLLQGVLSALSPEPRFAVTSELLEACPHSSVKALLVHQIKEEVLSAWPHEGEDSSSSPYIKMLMPLLQRLLLPPAKQLLFQHIDVLQSAINLYRLLLIKDRKNNVTLVWDSDRLQAMRDMCLDPLKSRMDQLITEFNGPSTDCLPPVPGAEGGGDDEARHSGMLHLQMLGEVVERVAELHSEGRGLQRFYREKVLDVD